VDYCIGKGIIVLYKDTQCVRNKMRISYSMPMRTCVFQTYTILANNTWFCNQYALLEEGRDTYDHSGYFCREQQKYFFRNEVAFW